MKTVTIILLTLILPPMNIFGQEVGHDRQPVVAGSFYPSGSEKIKSDLAGYFLSCPKPAAGVRVRAIIVPHAGYVYSGHTAAAGFAAVPPDAEIENIFLIGASHRFAFEGAAVFASGNMATPLGTVTVNKDIGNQLLKGSRWFITRDDAHRPEHSLEVQLPFIQYHFRKSVKVVPILIGTHNTSVLKSVAAGLKPWFNERNLFVISSDFSHYPSYSDACKADKLTSDAILTGDPNSFIRTINSVEASGIENLATAMCGWSAGLVLLYLTEDQNELKYRNIEYTNSGDSGYGDRDQVVGYNAIVVEEKVSVSSGYAAATAFALSPEEQKTLLNIAREAISARLKGVKPPPPQAASLTPHLREPLGAFVTLTIEENLRGCIGRFTSPDPLYEVVAQMAVEAAFTDPRFPALTAGEYPDIHLEISVLGPMKK
ncbi:MAG: AmmeMemoRadiSam system protein B, partial [Bacteroidales bacterium]|nr:AmmeMemoRadiSam system protein B [Bacteroidales bacterium]